MRGSYKIAVSLKNPLSQNDQISAEDAENISFAYYSGGDEVVQSYFKPYFNEKLALELSSIEKIVQASVGNLACGLMPERISRAGLLLPYGKETSGFLPLRDIASRQHTASFPSEVVCSLPKPCGSGIGLNPHLKRCDARKRNARLSADAHRVLVSSACLRHKGNGLFLRMKKYFQKNMPGEHIVRHIIYLPLFSNISLSCRPCYP